MTVFLPARHARHRPIHDYSDGAPPLPHPESPARVDAVLKGLRSAGGVELVEVDGFAEAQVRALHDADFVDFLLGIGAAVAPEAEYVPSMFGADLSRAPLRFRGGMYCRELGTPITSESVGAALNSAAAAIAAAGRVAEGAAAAFALCRPPGHHAGRRRYGGYCYFNNAYLAAGVLAPAGRCAVLDIDYHLGDGSMEFATPACPYYSLHADPWLNYPYLEADAALDSDCGRLMTLAQGTDGDAYLALLDGALDEVAGRGCDTLVVSTGFDTLGADTIQDTKLLITPQDFRRIGARIGSLGTRLLLVLEGGYNVAKLPECAAEFVGGIREGTRSPC
jgi:acetoin utilization deacetylase AcuC-like enzyme